MVAAFSIASQAANHVTFLSFRSVQGILLYATQILLIGLGETFVIITAGIDLSSGWMLGFSSVVAALDHADAVRGGRVARGNDRGGHARRHP